LSCESINSLFNVAARPGGRRLATAPAIAARLALIYQADPATHDGGLSMQGRAVMTALLLAMAMSPQMAFAHVTAHPNEAPAGTYFQSAFTVPHGCGGEPTLAVRVKIPEGVISVKPQMKPGWEVSIKMRRLQSPVDAGHGRMISETVDEVRWEGGPLPDAFFDTFGLVMKLPDTPGRTLYFPFVQECSQGVQRWISIPADGQKWHDLREPAPFIRLQPRAP
jgi:uncharacterized protein YcnI